VLKNYEMGNRNDTCVKKKEEALRKEEKPVGNPLEEKLTRGTGPPWSRNGNYTSGYEMKRKTLRVH